MSFLLKSMYCRNSKFFSCYKKLYKNRYKLTQSLSISNIYLKELINIDKTDKNSYQNCFHGQNPNLNIIKALI